MLYASSLNDLIESRVIKKWAEVDPIRFCGKVSAFNYVEQHIQRHIYYLCLGLKVTKNLILME